MILKTFSRDRGTTGCWTWYDNVERASLYYSEETGCTCVTIRTRGGEDETVVKITEPAYLCNDKGRTIERLYPTLWKPRHMTVSTINDDDDK